VEFHKKVSQFECEKVIDYVVYFMNYVRNDIA